MPEPFLISLRDLEIALPPVADGRGRRVRVSVRAIVTGFTGEDYDRFDTDEVVEIVRARTEQGALTDEILARQIRDEVIGITGVASAVVSVKDIDRHEDAEFLAVSTLPDPKHAVLYGVLP